MAVGRAYHQATAQLKRPPQTLNDLMPFLKKQGDPAKLLRSSDDGEEYRILWGVDVRTIQGPPASAPVLAYEQRGKGGKRFVLQGRQVFHLSDEDFQKAPFPSGRRPPS